MWIDWNNPNSVDFLPDVQPPKPKVLPKSKYNHDKELLDENKRLWIELKEKNEFVISLQDEIYYKQQELNKLEKCKQELDNVKHDQYYVSLVTEINKLKNDLLQKNNMIIMLNNMVENLCDELLQSEQIEHIEDEILRLQTETQRLAKENSDIKVKLKIVEHDNDKLQTRTRQLDDENHNLKKKLDKTTRKLKERENSLLNFKNFHELMNNLQTRISRSKNENVSLKGALEKMTNLANNYDKLERENAELKKLQKELEDKNENLKNSVLTLQQKQIQIKEDEAVTKPALVRENQNLKKQLASVEENLHGLLDTNVKLKTNLKIYEKMLMESKAYVAKQETQTSEMRTLIEENQNMKNLIQNLNHNLNRESSNKNNLLKENENLQQEYNKLSELLQKDHLEKETMTKEVIAMKGNCEEAEIEIDDLKKQLKLCKNTIHNQGAELHSLSKELHSLSKENKELRLNVKQYENQIQMDGKVYKLVR